MIHVSIGNRSRSPLSPLSLRMMSRADFRSAPSDRAVVGEGDFISLSHWRLSAPELWNRPTTHSYLMVSLQLGHLKHDCDLSKSNGLCAALCIGVAA